MIPSESWERGERRRTRTIGFLTGAVALLAVALLLLSGLVLDQRERLSVVGRQNDELVELLNGRTEIIARIDETEQRSACLVRELGRTFVAGVRVLLADEDDPATRVLLTRLEGQLAALEEAVGGDCPEVED